MPRKPTATASHPMPTNPAAVNEWNDLENAVNRAAALLSMVTEKLSFLLEASEPEGEASGSIQFGIMDLSRQAVDGLIDAHRAAFKSHCDMKKAAGEAEFELP
jgi:hypothetical protein